jgi:hypothetical protein
MKELLLSFLLISFCGDLGHPTRRTSSDNLVEVRTGDWPISLERSVEDADTSYSLQFRDNQVLTSVVMDTLPFVNLSQLKYFGQALSVLRVGSNGDIARFKDYSIKRTDRKSDGTWYVLQHKYGITDFKQPEADIMISTIRKL